MSSGTWSCNQKHGEGVYIYPDGRIYFGDFDKDRIVDPVEAALSTEDISSQMRLNIEDVFGRFSAVPAAPASESVPSTSSNLTHNSRRQSTNHPHHGHNANHGSVSHSTAPHGHHPSHPSHHHSGHTHGARTSAPPLQQKRTPVVVAQHQATLRGTASLSLGTTGAVGGSASALLSSLRCVDAVASVSSSILSQVRECERLLLRYNSSLRSYYRRLVEIANRRRQKDLVFTLTGDKSVQSWPRIEQVMYQARDIFRRFCCSSLDQMRRALRELDILNFGGHFTSYDLTLCRRKMLENQKLVQATAISLISISI